MGKPTIRELLDEHAGKIWSESRQENVLASDALAERVEAVLKLTGSRGDDQLLTVGQVRRALNGEA